MTKDVDRFNRRQLVVGLWISLAASVFGLMAMVSLAIFKVRGGQALDSFRNHWLVESNWLSFLIFVVVAAFAVAVGLWFRIREARELEALGKEGRHG
jgi:hypothetical protein